MDTKPRELYLLFRAYEVNRHMKHISIFSFNLFLFWHSQHYNVLIWNNEEFHFHYLLGLWRFSAQSHQQKWKNVLSKYMIWLIFWITFWIIFIVSVNEVIYSTFLCLQPVGFVTFNTRAGAESAKQDLQVSKHCHIDKHKRCKGNVD